MPPATESVLHRIIQNLEAALNAVDAGDDYFYTLNVVPSGKHLSEVYDFPAVIIGAGDWGILDSNERGPLWSNTTHWRVSVVGILDQISDEPFKDVTRLEHDILKATQLDPQRGNLARDTTWLGSRMVSPQDDNQDRIWLECLLDIHFATDRTDRTVKH